MLHQDEFFQIGTQASLVSCSKKLEQVVMETNPFLVNHRKKAFENI